MSVAAAAVQAALVTALRGHAPLAEVSGVFLGPPARAAYPYVAIGAAASVDWSHKTGRGREHRVTVSLWDDDAARAIRLSGETETAIEGMARVLDGHRVVSLALVRTRMLRERGDGPWAGIVEYRLRTLEA
jgi:hypothetical protein